MTASEAFTAFRVAERLKGRLEPPWEVFGEKLRRYEVHLNGSQVEMDRGPIRLEGFGIRLFRGQGDETGVGFAAATDLSDGSIDHRAADAEATAKFARFPARRVELPSRVTGAGPAVETVDRRLWEAPLEALQTHVHALLTAFEGRVGVIPSFGSLRATLAESTLTNSEGIQRRHRHTSVEFEIAVKAFGGPEGRPPGEYWVNRKTRDLTERGLSPMVDGWCRRAQDVRVARPTPPGLTKVALPVSVLSDVLPNILGFRLGGAAELRKMAPESGTAIGTPALTLYDDGLLPFGLGSAPYDDEGYPQARRTVIDKGVVTTPAYDVLYASALGKSPTGNGQRQSPSYTSWFRFIHPPMPQLTNLVIRPGDAGSDSEIAEQVGEGLWLDQLGYAFPDSFSGAFGGEIRIGYRIKNGKMAEPVRGGTVGGVVLSPPGEPSLLSSVRGVGTTASLSDFLSAPTLWADGLTIAASE